MSWRIPRVSIALVLVSAALPGLANNAGPGGKDETPPASAWRELIRWQSHHRDAFLAFSPDCKTLVTAEDSIKLWDPTNGKELANFSAPTTWYQFIGFSADGKALVAREDAPHPPDIGLSQKPELTFFDLATGQPQQAVKLPEPFVALFRCPDGKSLVGWLPRSVRLWDLAGKELAAFEAPPKAVPCVVLSPDGVLLAVGSGDGFGLPGEVDVWDLAARKRRFVLRGSGQTSALAFSPDGRTLVSGGKSGGGLTLWEMATGKVRGVLKTTRGQFFSVAFSPDGKTVAANWRDLGSGDTPAGVVLWDLLSGQELAILKGHRGIVRTVAFSPDGRMLAASGSDGTIIVWQPGQR